MPLAEALLVQRLSLIRFLHESAIEQSRQTGWRQATSILMFHDAVEMFLALSLEHKNIPNKNFHFREYWAELKKAGTALTQEASLDRLNRVRVALKHHGVMPAPESIEEARVNTSDFFRENTHSMFDIAFEAISLSSVVQHETARGYLLAAEKLMYQRDTTDANYEEAAGEIAIALRILLADYRGKTESPHSGLMFGRSWSSSPLQLRSIEARGGVGIPRDAADMLERFAQEVAESVSEIWSRLDIVALGLNYHRYRRFEVLSPSITWNREGRRYVRSSTTGRSVARTLEDCQFCLNFVIDAAVRLQELDVDP
jgi:hypothetical protein